MIDYAAILTLNYPDTLWTLVGYDYTALQWQDESPKPIQAELDALWEATQTQITAKEQAKIDTKQSAFAKLTAIGLTEDEIKAIVG